MAGLAAGLGFGALAEVTKRGIGVSKPSDGGENFFFNFLERSTAFISCVAMQYNCHQYMLTMEMR